jgi:hypothetical protein
LTFVTSVNSIVRTPDPSVGSNCNVRSSSISMPSTSSGPRSSSTIHTVMGYGMAPSSSCGRAATTYPMPMAFVDECTLYVSSGRGGDGSVSMHSEPYKARGGPDGAAAATAAR